MVAAVTLLPALLSYLGPRVDRLRIPFLGRSLSKAEGDGESPAARWSHAVQRRPWTARSPATALLLALAAPALGMRLGFPDAGNDPPDTMTRQAYDLNTEGFGPGTNGPLVIAAELPDAGAQSEIDALADAAARGARGRLRAPTPVSTRRRRGDRHRDPDHARRRTRRPRTWSTRLRDDVVPEALSGTGVTAEVGGVTAALEDQSEYITDRMPLFIVGVVGLSFLLLLVAFHSPLISLKAGIMNLLSVSAAYGVMTLVAQGGTVGELIGIDHEVPIAPFMPVMMFAILFGLSMDYEVFLISRIREEYLKDGDTRRAVADGLAKTARVITAAAAIMVVVFLAFLAAPDVFLKLFGIGLAVGDLPRRHRRADGAGAGRDAAARRPQLVDPGLARAEPAAARRRARRGRHGGGPALGVVFVVQSPPAVRWRLRTPLGRVLPLLLAAQRGQVEQRPIAGERLDAAPVGEVSAEDPLAIANEDAEAESFTVLVAAGLGLKG